MSEVSAHELDVYTQVEEYILDLQNSPNVMDQSRAKTLAQNLYNIPHACREGFVKLIKSGWEYLDIGFLDQSLMGKIELVFTHKSTSQAVRLNQEGKIVGIINVIINKNPRKTDAPYGEKWKQVNYTVDEFLSYFNSMQKIDKSDKEAIENL